MPGVRVHRVRLLFRVGAVAVAALATFGCMTVPRQPYLAEGYRIELTLDSVTHRVEGRTTIDLKRDGDQDPSIEGPVTVELLLHPALKIRQIHTDAATIRRHSVRRLAKPDDGQFQPRKHAVVLDRAVEALSLVVEYDGELIQDAAVGERPGQIHNFEMRAHVGEDGIYLADGYWYPQPDRADGLSPVLADFTLLVDPVEGMELVAGAESAPDLGEPSGRLAWRSPYALEQMVLAGGPHEVHRRPHGGRMVSLHLKPSQAGQVEGLFAAAARNLDRYEPLIGPYPAGEFAIVDNFFSSGFAFPTFTLLSSAVIDMGERSQTAHGYIDHEMLHCWWGNGIHVDPRDGNWCEALASYGANYYGYVLDGNADEARRKRRNYTHFLSRRAADRDKPLDTFGREDGAGRGIGYDKGAAVFHMLARKIGQENFWAAMRQFTQEYVGRFASWGDIRRLCEAQYGGSLETFFRQWVRSAGAPAPVIENARFDESSGALTLLIAQGEPPFELDLPIRISHGGGYHDVDVHVEESTERVTIPVDVIPVSVEVDPDYHVFRRIPLEQIVPTTAATQSGESLVIVLPAGDVADRYKGVQGIFESPFADDRRREFVAGAVEGGPLTEANVLVLGDAVHDVDLAAFLESMDFPVSFSERGFRYAGQEFTGEGDAILCTASHPDLPGGGVTVLFANADDAIPRPQIIPFYDRSVIIFRDGAAVHRDDLERRSLVPVERT